MQQTVAPFNDLRTVKTITETFYRVLNKTIINDNYFDLLYFIAQTYNHDKQTSNPCSVYRSTHYVYHTNIDTLFDLFYNDFAFYDTEKYNINIF